MAAKILIVEDEPGLLEGLQHNFQFEGYEVVTAANGRDGLKSALKEKPELAEKIHKAILEKVTVVGGATVTGEPEA